jgi:hypothetical protein
MFRTIKSLAALTFLAAAATSQAVAEDFDPFVGEWAGDCGGKAQCWVEIEYTDQDAYRLRFVVAERLDHTKELCSALASLKRHDDLVGRFDKGEALTVKASDSSVVLQTDGKCSQYRMAGEFQVFGD